MKSNRWFAPLFFVGIAMILTSNAHPASAGSNKTQGGPADVCSLLSLKTATAVIHAKVQPHSIPEGPSCVWSTSWPPSQSGTGAGMNVNVNVVSAETLKHVDQAIATFHGQWIQGLGDKAAWYPKHGDNAGHLAVYKGNRLITIQIGRSGEIANDLEGSKIVAREILRRL
jgi:hypothetical protein